MLCIHQFTCQFVIAREVSPQNDAGGGGGLRPQFIISFYAVLPTTGPKYLEGCTTLIHDVN